MSTISYCIQIDRSARRYAAYQPSYMPSTYATSFLPFFLPSFLLSFFPSFFLSFFLPTHTTRINYTHSFTAPPVDLFTPNRISRFRDLRLFLSFSFPSFLFFFLMGALVRPRTKPLSHSFAGMRRGEASEVL